MARGGSGKKKRKVWFEFPIGSKMGKKERCSCHYSCPCPRAAVVKGK